MTGHIDNRTPRGEYHIEFDTTSTPGFLRAVKVTLEVDMLPDDTASPKEEQARYSVDLLNHPLYPQLQNYVLNNLPRSMRRKLGR